MEAPAETRGGLELEQVAAVHAAVAEGHDLVDVLRVEDLDGTAWAAGDRSWKVALVDDEALLGRYRNALETAQERLARRVAPLEDDLDAWTAFLHLYGAHPARFLWLEELSLGLNDMTRLQRRWDARFEGDAALAKQAVALAERLDRRAEAGAEVVLPPLDVEPIKLVASPRRVVVAPAAAPTPAPAAAPTMAIDRYAALVAELTLLPPRERAAALERFGLDVEGAKRADATWRAALDADPALARDFRALLGHYERAVKVRLRHAAAPASAPAAPLPVASTPPPPVPATPAASASIDETAAVGMVLDLEPLPFSGRVASLPLIDFDALFDEAPPPPSDLDGTGALVLDLLEAPATPFATSTSGLDETGALSLDMLEVPATPFAEDEAPALTIEQLASLHVEQARQPQARAAVRARYHLPDDAAQERLEAHYRARFATNPSEHARYLTCFDRYHAWLEDHHA